MDTAAVVTMVIGMLIIWGGLTASVLWAVKVARASGASGSDEERHARPDL